MVRDDYWRVCFRFKVCKMNYAHKISDSAAYNERLEYFAFGPLYGWDYKGYMIPSKDIKAANADFLQSI